MSSVTQSSSTTPNSQPAATSAAASTRTAAAMVASAATVTLKLRVATNIIAAAAAAETGGLTNAVCRMLSSTPRRFHTSHACTTTGTFRAEIPSVPSAPSREYSRIARAMASFASRVAAPTPRTPRESRRWCWRRGAGPRNSRRSGTPAPTRPRRMPIPGSRATRARFPGTKPRAPAAGPAPGNVVRRAVRRLRDDVRDERLHDARLRAGARREAQRVARGAHHLARRQDASLHARLGEVERLVPDGRAETRRVVGVRRRPVYRAHAERHAHGAPVPRYRRRRTAGAARAAGWCPAAAGAGLLRDGQPARHRDAGDEHEYQARHQDGDAPRPATNAPSASVTENAVAAS